MPTFLVPLIVFLALSVRAEALPLSASLDGFSVGGSTGDTTLAADCLPGNVCEPTKKRAIELKLPSAGTPEQKVPIEIIVIPEIPVEKIAPIEAILKQKLPNEGEELFKVLEPELPNFEKEFEKPHLTIGIINKNPTELPVYKSTLEELSNELLYKGEGTFLAGHNPRGMAIVLFNPETEVGFATVTLFAIPLPMSLLLVLAGLVALPLCRRP